MGNTESIEEEIATFIESAQEDEEIADLAEVESMEDEIVGFLCREVAFQFGQQDEQKDDGWEDIAEDL